ncbi:MAG: hypothetical protein EZS28_042857 [Streblomastix strix]|uniref:NrS-1 polymerase-like helicase domain-containing protein n=1 Tax=Streblomastix strix TaxID=222440 RepID=A0A5J4TST8_9EUKA|nr:MAG: hypothetical protein EZS28_042857 [Streblomastix strix]
MQNVEKKTDTAPRYSSKNVTDIDDKEGKFNAAIENEKLMTVNEMKNCGDARMPNMDALKSIITNNSFQVKEKNVPKQQVGNVKLSFQTKRLIEIGSIQQF